MRKIIFAGVFIINLLFIKTNLFSQVTIKGPKCVVPGVTYTYNIAGKWDSVSTMKICLSGGVIADSTGKTICTLPGAPLNAVTVIWKNVKKGSVSLTSSSGDNTLDINITTPLKGGVMDTLTKTQMISNDSMPAAIICTEAFGGACSPSYSYQWQKSSDIVSWSDIPLASRKNLAIDSLLKQTTYYRRKVMENTSGSVAYSDVAAVFVSVTGLQSALRIYRVYCFISKDLNGIMEKS